MIMMMTMMIMTTTMTPVMTLVLLVMNMMTPRGGIIDVTMESFPRGLPAIRTCLLAPDL